MKCLLPFAFALSPAYCNNALYTLDFSKCVSLLLCNSLRYAQPVLEKQSKIFFHHIFYIYVIDCGQICYAMS